MMHNKSLSFRTGLWLAAAVALAPSMAGAADDNGVASAPVTAWTPDGTAVFVQPSDPVLVADPAAVLPKFVKPDSQFVNDLLTLMDRSLTALSEKSSDADTEFYEGGEWRFTPPVLVCGAGPAGMAAMLWKWRQAHPEQMDAAAKARQPWLHEVAVTTFDHIITKYQQPSGELANAGSHECFFWVEQANTYLLLKDSLDAPTRERWLNAMRLAVKYMQAKGLLADPSLQGWKGTDGWYVNGNVDICETTFVYLVWQATGEQQYKDLFEIEWKHVLSPDQARWKGYGFYFLKMPQNKDGSDGSGYITEANGAPGFDRNYGQLQLGIGARLYARSRDPRVLHALNMMCNSLLPHLDRDTMVLNCLYGSRHSDFMPFATSGVPVLAWLGGRGDLLPLLSGWMQKAAPTVFLENATKNQNNPYAYRGYGFDLETTLEAALLAEQPPEHK